MIFWISTSFKNKPPNIIQTKKFTNINTRKYRIKENHKIIPKSMQNKILLHILYISNSKVLCTVLTSYSKSMDHDLISSILIHAFNMI